MAAAISPAARSAVQIGRHTHPAFINADPQGRRQKEEIANE
ncbi:MAG TPA: hypothetical protein VGJ97_03840 [Anaerolineaceae bacterium]|jgi:hypothetical protein